MNSYAMTVRCCTCAQAATHIFWPAWTIVSDLPDRPVGNGQLHAGWHLVSSGVLPFSTTGHLLTAHGSRTIVDKCYHSLARRFWLPPRPAPDTNIIAVYKPRDLMRSMFLICCTLLCAAQTYAADSPAGAKPK